MEPMGACGIPCVGVLIMADPSTVLPKLPSNSA